MQKMVDMTDEELLGELGIEIKPEVKSSRTPREERIIAGFEDIERFYTEQGRLPRHGEDKDIFERLYAVRLDQMRSSEECLNILRPIDKQGLLDKKDEDDSHTSETNLTDDELLSELGIQEAIENDITHLTHVKTRSEIRTAEEIAKRTPCTDFENFKPLFVKVQQELQSGERKTLEFKEGDDVKIRKGEFFILSGQKAYIADWGEEFRTGYDKLNRKLRVIYDNGTESDMLLLSFQRALYKDETSRRISDPSIGPLFSSVAEEDDITTGTIYVLRSQSEHPLIKENREIIHKIGVTTGDLKRRIASAKLDPTFLMADVEIIATYGLSNIKQIKFEQLIHRCLGSAQLDIQIPDRLGNFITPKEWFLVPLFIIDEIIERIKDGSIVNLRYDPNQGVLLF
jgi:transcription antitermination factor NusG